MKLHDFLAGALRKPMHVGTGRLITVGADVLGGDDTEDSRAVRAAVETQINKFSLRSLKLEDVHVRGMNAANNVIDYYDSRFTEKGLRQAASIYAPSAMAAGHDMTRTPLATVFAGDVLKNDAGSRVRELRDVSLASWLRGLWYVPRSLSWANDLVEAVDTGVQREVSLHWYFTEAKCGICSNDIRACEHFPGETYDDKRCWYEMEGVTDILETSFVIKGGQRGTSLWNPSDARGMNFGRAIRELKSDRQAFSDWKRAFDPSSNGRASRGSNRAASWLGSGMRPTA